MIAWLARLNGDATLVGLLGGAGRILAAQASRPVTIPSIEWQVYGDTEEESFNPVSVRLDLFVTGVAKADQVEARVRNLSHRDTAQAIGSVRGWIRHLDTRDIEFPSQPGVVHRALDFTLEAVRHKYHAA